MDVSGCRYMQLFIMFSLCLASLPGKPNRFLYFLRCVFLKLVKRLACFKRSVTKCVCEVSFNFTLFFFNFFLRSHGATETLGHGKET